MNTLCQLYMYCVLCGQQVSSICSDVWTTNGWLCMYILLLRIYCCWFVDCQLLHIICFWPVPFPLTARLVQVVLFLGPNFSFPFSWRLLSQCAGLFGLSEMIKFSEIFNLAEMSVDFQEVISLFSNFQSLASCNPNRGDTTLFWTDKLTCHNQNQSSKDLYPQLYSFSKKQKCSLQFYVEQEAIRLFSLPLSQLAE